MASAAWQTSKILVEKVNQKLRFLFDNTQTLSNLPQERLYHRMLSLVQRHFTKILKELEIQLRMLTHLPVQNTEHVRFNLSKYFGIQRDEPHENYVTYKSKKIEFVIKIIKTNETLTWWVSVQCTTTEDGCVLFVVDRSSSNISTLPPPPFHVFFTFSSPLVRRCTGRRGSG